MGSSLQGLDDAAVTAARASYGWNELPQREKSLWSLLRRQFQDVLIYILLGALLLTIVIRLLEGNASLENSIDIIAIVLILVLNAALGFVQEFRSEQALAGLKKLASPQTRVRRGGREYFIPSRELIPGDIIILETGDKIAADARLLSVSHLEINESSLTGESLPVAKHTSPTKPEAPMGDQRSMVFAGTLVTMGSGEAMVTATGTHSAIGEIATMVLEAESPPTPLEERMKRFSGIVGILVTVLCLTLAIILSARGAKLLDVVLLTVSLAVSAVPEGLPAVVTACLAMGVRRMAAMHALVMRLDALETLGSITVICSDKTGTITENRMKVREIWVTTQEKQAAPHSDNVKLLLQIAASCNRAQLPDLGDPTELGLLRYAAEQGIERIPWDEEEVPFTSEAKYMRTRHAGVSYIKGAPERVITLCRDIDEDQILEQSALMARNGLRVLAMAAGTGDVVRFVGLMGMEDPPREAVTAALEEAKRAGIRTIMITGDSPDTALSIAGQVGMGGHVVDHAMLTTLTPDMLRETVRSVSIFARVSPQHKIAILQALQANGEIVAMTGDGVNDAPALKAADVGIAMGRDGTEVAREAASMILTDDNYATIVRAIREGRRMYDNIRKFILYLVRANLGQMILFTLTVIIGLPLPLLPIHILWINLMTDGLPALALGLEREEPGIMRRPPRKRSEQLFTGEWGYVLTAALTSCGLTLLLFLWALRSGMPIDAARTIVFTFSIFFELLLAFHSRSHHPLWRMGVLSNRSLLWAALLPLVLQAALLTTSLAIPFGLVRLPVASLTLLLMIGALGFAFLECTKLWGERARAR